MRVADACQQPGDTLEAENVGTGGERGEAVELALDGGIGGAGEILLLPLSACEEGAGERGVRKARCTAPLPDPLP